MKFYEYVLNFLIPGFNCVVVGNNNIGKTSLLMTYHQHKFPEDVNLIPTMFERFISKITIEGKEIELQIIDSNEEYEQNLKTISEAQVVIICFSLISPKSYNDVESRWLKIVKKEASGVPYILVGTKSDLRDDFDNHRKELEKKGFEPISTKKGHELKEKIGAVEYFECSAKLEINITNTFKYAARAAVEHKNSHCNVF